MRADAVYRALLHCYPAAFRDEYGTEMQRVFAEQLGRAKRTGGGLKRASLWVEAAWDAVTVAPGEHWHVLFEDLRYALRTMAARPAFSAIAILSLALGIGANSAIFSLWNSVLHATLAGVHNPGQLVILSNPDTAGGWHGSARGDRDWLTYAEFEQLREQSRSFSGVMAAQSFLSQWRVRFNGSEWEEVHGRLVSNGYFQVLGVSPALGLVFEGDESTDSPYAVISYNYWQRRFGGNADILGRTFRLRNASLTVIGVAPAGFQGETAGQQPDLWIPLRLQPSVMPGQDTLHDTPPSKTMWLHVFGRLKPGVTAARAEAESNAIFKTGLQAFYGNVASAQQRLELLDQHLKVRPGARGASETRSNFSTSLTALLASAGALLAIACANLANLQLARGTARRPELALRVSLGASRRRILRLLITESMVLAVTGGLGGLAAAFLLHGALVRMIAQADEDFRMSFALDPLVLLFTTGVTLGAALLFGVLPAWQITGSDSVSGVREHSPNATGSVRAKRWGQLLVSLQLALSLPLLVGAGLLARTVYNLEHQVDLGYSAGRLLQVRIDPREAGYDTVRSGLLFRDLLGRIQQIPGVKAATFSENGIFTGSISRSSVEVEGFTGKQEQDREVAMEVVGPGYFSTLRIPIALGREITGEDGAGTSRVCVINQAFAQHFLAGWNPLGMRVTSTGGTKRTACQVIGVAGNARTETPRGRAKPRFYIPATQPLEDKATPAHFLIRTTIETAPVLASVRRTVRRVNAALPISTALSLEEQMQRRTAQDHTAAQLAVVFGCAALALAATGLYGVLSYSIARRTGEIAIRMALGARPGRVITMILGETCALILSGVTAGAILAYVASRLITSQLYGISPQDPLTMAAAIGLLVLVALSAVYLPARRASRLDPMKALRQE